MQMVMIPPDLRLFRVLLPLGLVVLLAGCATQPRPLPPPAPGITAPDFETAVHNAYQQGFEAGRHYQYRRDARLRGAAQAMRPGTTPQNLTDASPPIPTAAAVPSVVSGNAQAPVPTAPAAAPPPQAANPASPPATLPPSAKYTTSGPAQPLQ